MAYGDVKTQFLGLLNRRDITPSVTDTILGYALQRIQRKVRVPAMERIVSVTCDGSSLIPVPGDYLEVISLNTNDQSSQTKLVKSDLQTILTKANYPGNPTVYHRVGPNFHIGPYPPDGTLIWIHYYADAPALSADTDENWITEIAPQLLVYAGLSYACDYFLDDRKGLFEATYLQLEDELEQMGLEDDLINSSIGSSFCTY
jgi:hypothetical protein